MTEQEWQRMERTMRYIVEQQANFEAKFEASFARANGRFEQAERRMDRLERFAERAMRAADRRMARSEAEIADLRAEFRAFLRALRRSGGDGKGRS